MKQCLYYMALLICVISGMAFAQDVNKEAKQNDASDQIYRMQIRVIFAGGTGIYGSVPRELADMQGLLTSSFRYPSFELAHTIRLSVFGDEEISALVFPEHYLRVRPRGSTQDGEGLKAKVEIYHVPPRDNTETRYFLGNRDLLDRGDDEEEENEREVEKPRNRANDSESKVNFPLMGVEERVKKQGRKPLFPVMSSAVLLTEKDWEAFGGVPITVNSRNQISSNTLSAGGSVTRGGGTTGVQKNLIVGIKLERR